MSYGLHSIKQEAKDPLKGKRSELVSRIFAFALFASVVQKLDFKPVKADCFNKMLLPEGC